MFFFFFCRHLVSFSSSSLNMSNSSRSQPCFPTPTPTPTPVRIHSNYPVLPPITATNRSTEQESQPIQSSLNVPQIDVKCETPPVDSKDFWVRLREDIAKERLEHSNQHGNQQTPNKVVRIFVSSTFTDFFNEREVLIKKVMKTITIKSLLFWLFLE
jgi:hypothetical protein